MNWIFTISFCFLTTIPFLGETCTAFQLKAQDGSYIYGRSMEFGFRLDSDLLIVPRDMEYIGTAPDGLAGLKWKTKYGYVGMNQSIAKTVVSDGMNEKGLVASLLYLPGYAEYQKSDSKKTDRTIGAWELPTFLLGTCSTTQEAKAVLSSIHVAEQPTPHLGNFVLPLHFYISDRTGAVLIVEYSKGEMNIYDNPLGVLTNSPTFDWHLTNLENYINLSPFNAPELNLSSWTVHNYGQGSGLLGLPGDYTPASRFVKAVLFSQWALQAKNAIEAVNTGFHILNTFDIFEGIIRTQSNEKNNITLPVTKTTTSTQIHEDMTEWTIVHDKSNLKTYFRTYESLRIQMVDFTKIDFSKKGLWKIPLAKDFTIEDVSQNANPLIE